MRTIEKGRAPFTALGVEGDTYFFRRYGERDVFKIRHFRRVEMERLAPLSYWQETYHRDSGCGIDWVRAKWDVMAQCQARGDRLVRRLTRVDVSSEQTMTH